MSEHDERMAADHRRMGRTPPSAGADPEPPPAIVNIGQEASLRDVEWFKKGWEARAQGEPSLDVDRLARALDVLSEDGLEYDLMAPEEREGRYDAAERLAARYARLSVAPEASEDQ